jgi:uncharacterized repeat protein (TIGR01451 family)
MRTRWKRTAVGLVLAGIAGGAALGLARPSDPPAVIPPADGPAGPPVLPVVHLEGGRTVPVAGPATPAVAPVAPTDPAPRTDPAIALEWSGPPVVKANRPAEYTLTVRNTCGQPLQKVVVQVRVPKGVAVKGTSPASAPADDVHLWELGTLDSRGAKAVKLTVVPPTTGELTCQAWVTLTGTAAMTAAVKEPKLAVVLKAPDKVVVGDKIPVEYVVTNTGDLPAEGVVLRLANSATPPMAARDLKPGEAHKLTDEFVTTSGGTFTYEAVATGTDGLTAAAKTAVQVLVPKLDVSMTGPADRLIGKKAAYTVTVRNCGDVPVTGVVVREHVPAGFRVVSAGADGVLSPAGDRVSWSVGDLAAGAVKELAFDGLCSQPGSLQHRVEVVGERNTKAAADCGTKVEGIPALRMEMVDAVDPVEKGGETVYEIKVTNTGTKADADVKVVCELPPEFEYVSSSGPTAVTQVVGYETKGNAQVPSVRTVAFEPISELAPKTEAVFKVKVRATGTGDVRFKAVLTSKHLTAPVTKEESTRVYGE